MITILATLALLAAPQQTASAASATAELKAQYDFGACVARDRTKSGTLLATVPGSDEESRLLGALMTDGCPGVSEVTLDSALLRGMVAEAMFMQDFGALGTARSTTMSVFRMPDAGALRSMPARQQYAVAMVDYGSCIVGAAPQQSIALLHSAPASADERAAFATLGSALGPCLPQGMKLEFTRPQLRGVIAEAAYRAAAHP